MHIRKLIAKTIFEHLMNEEDAHFLSNFESAKEFAYQNIDDVASAFDAYKENPDDMNVSYMRDRYIDLIYAYVDKFDELKNQETATIYRLVKLNSIDDLHLDNIGMHWSFERDGVGDYGGTHPNRAMTKTGQPFILRGKVNPKHIDWDYGFHSFIWYGEDQWECALKKGAKVVIDAINDKELESPIIATVGDH